MASKPFELRVETEMPGQYGLSLYRMPARGESLNGNSDHWQMVVRVFGTPMQAMMDQAAVEAARQRVTLFTEDLKTIERRMATERDDDRYLAIAKQFDNIKAELKLAMRTLEDREKLCEPPEQRSPNEEVALALQLVENFKRVTCDKSARAEIRPLLLKYGIRLGLNFGAAMKGTREVRKFLGGVIAFGSKPLPVPIHGHDNRDDGAPGHSESNGQTAKESADTLKSDRIAGLAPITGDGSQAPAVSGNDRQHEGVSFTKVSRDDRI